MKAKKETIKEETQEIEIKMEEEINASILEENSSAKIYTEEKAESVTVVEEPKQAIVVEEPKKYEIVNRILQNIQLSNGSTIQTRGSLIVEEITEQIKNMEKRGFVKIRKCNF